MKIGFLCKHNPYDRNAFSGTPFYALKALRAAKGVEVEVLGGHRPPSPLRRIAAKLRAPAAVAPEDVKTEGLDWIVTLVSSELIEPVAARGAVPIVHVTDATPGFLRDFYKWDVDPARDAVEGRALGAAGLAAYSSSFMAERAAREFPEVEGKTAAIPFGVNLDDLPAAPPPKPPRSPLRLLFVGKNWERKGGAVALDAVVSLRREGIDARLDVVGCDPEEARAADGVEVHPFLDKNDPADAAKLTSLFRDAHFFLLPTKADCTPMVVAEANAYGAPVLITETGGIGSLMRPGANGEMLTPGASGADYAERIKALAGDGYDGLSASSHAHFRERLNWDAWARDLVAEMKARA
ncbi:MAG: glycosyltransferase family 4 protein [Pseudomonadota bacterium]